MPAREKLIQYLHEMVDMFPREVDAINQLIDEVIQEAQATAWISVDERLPEEHQVVIAFDGMQGVNPATLVFGHIWAWDQVVQQQSKQRHKSGDTWWIHEPGEDNGELFNVTHWMPLPQAPKEGEAL